MIWYIIGVIVLLIIIGIIIKIVTKPKEEDFWDTIDNVGRGACAKLKEMFWGC